MSLNRKLWLCAITLLFSGLFIRLGFWQLSRRTERISAAATRAVRATQMRLDWSVRLDVPDDTAGLVGRSARLTGRWDRANEVVLRSRTLDGRAGVEVLTPLRIGDPGEGGALSEGREDGATTVMVLRGWLPASDGLRADLASGWSGVVDGPVDVEGVLISSRDGRGGQPLWIDTGGARHLALAGIDLAQVRSELSLEVSPHVLRADDRDHAIGVLRPARQVVTGNGPHLSYALQWFSFAAITVFGTAALIRRERVREPPI